MYICIHIYLYTYTVYIYMYAAPCVCTQFRMCAQTKYNKYNEYTSKHGISSDIVLVTNRVYIQSSGHKSAAISNGYA